jgi:hypothetical protein
MDPQEVKHELLFLYARIHLHLTFTVPVARGIVKDLADDNIFNNDILHEELQYRLIHFIDQLLDMVYLIRLACQLYKQLPEHT